MSKSRTEPTQGSERDGSATLPATPSLDVLKTLIRLEAIHAECPVIDLDVACTRYGVSPADYAAIRQSARFSALVTKERATLAETGLLSAVATEMLPDAITRLAHILADDKTRPDVALKAVSMVFDESGESMKVKTGISGGVAAAEKFSITINLGDDRTATVIAASVPQSTNDGDGGDLVASY